MKKAKIIAISTIALLLIGGCMGGEQSTSTEESIKIGLIGPLTGDAASYGLPLQRVINIALEDINANGGNIEAIWEDGKCTNKDSAAATNKLINLDKVKVIVGGFCSSETLAAAPLAESSKVVMLSPASSSPDITNAGDFIFRNYPSDSAQGKILADEAIKREYKKVAVISEQNDYPMGVKNVFVEHFEKQGGEVLVETFLPDAADFKAALTKLKNFEADALLIAAQTASKGDGILAQMKDLNIETTVIAIDTILGSDETITKYATLFENGFGAETEYDINHEGFKNVMATYKANHLEELPYKNYMATAYDAAYIISEALEAHGNDSEKIKTYLYNIKDRKGAAGNLTIDSNGDPESGHTLKGIKEGVKSNL